jgi:hypothetical protein
VAGSGHGEHGRGQPLIVGGLDRTQIEQQPSALDPADYRGHLTAAHRLARPQPGRQAFRQGKRGAGQTHPGASAAADRGGGRYDLAVDAGRGQPFGLGLGALGDPVRAGGQALGNGGRRAGERRFEGGQRQLVHP